MHRTNNMATRKGMKGGGREICRLKSVIAMAKETELSVLMTDEKVIRSLWVFLHSLYVTSTSHAVWIVLQVQVMYIRRVQYFLN